MTSMSGFHGKTSVGMGLGLTKAILDPSSFERFDAFEKIMKPRRGQSPVEYRGNLYIPSVRPYFRPYVRPLPPDPLEADPGLSD